MSHNRRGGKRGRRGNTTERGRRGRGERRGRQARRGSRCRRSAAGGDSQRGNTPGSGGQRIGGQHWGAKPLGKTQPAVTAGRASRSLTPSGDGSTPSSVPPFPIVSHELHESARIEAHLSFVVIRAIRGPLRPLSSAVRRPMRDTPPDEDSREHRLPEYSGFSG